MRQSAARVALATLVVVGVVVGVLALWKLKVLIALLFLAFIVAAAMRPSIELRFFPADNIPARLMGDRFVPLV
jgi:hypothetical protein